MTRENLILENSIGDLKINSIADRGFCEAFVMSPELHSHSYYEVLLALDGDFFLNLADGKRMKIRRGNFCLISPGLYHGTCALEEDSRKLALRFRYAKDAEKRVEESLYEIFHHVMVSCRDVTLVSEDAQMMDCMELLRQEILSPGRATKEYMEVLLSRFYLLLMRKLCDCMGENEEKKRAEERDDRDQRRLWVEDYFQAHYSEPITEAHMAKEMCLSRRQVSRVLREIYGKSFRQFLIEERLNRAAQLLLSTNRSVEEIAEEVGYTSLSGFYSAFRQVFGISAGKYRKEFLKKQ